jgi:hypothetical protein
MASVPSIKGSVMAGVVENVAKLVSHGDLSREELLRRLPASDVALLDQEIPASQWYDIRTYDRMNTLLLDLVGHGNVDYYREQGRKTALRLIDGGLYAQLEYLDRTQVATREDPQARFEAFGRDLRLLNTLSASILSFSRWTHSVDPDHERRYRIDVLDADDMPESLRWRSEGFMNGMAAAHGHADDLWFWDRSVRDHVVYRMLRSP